jgi:hypothetical protein
MANKVLSIRLPRVLADAARLHASRRDGATVSNLLDILLRSAIEEHSLVPDLPDTADVRDTKLDLRLPPATLEALRCECERIRTFPSVYVRVLLHNYYVTERLQIVEEGGRYKLAVCP